MENTEKSRQRVLELVQKNLNVSIKSFIKSREVSFFSFFFKTIYPLLTSFFIGVPGYMWTFAGVQRDGLWRQRECRL